MLCRAVLAATAISCTFTLALANTQGTELVQIKDLVCVLWLSGLQKEDMDVNLLKKLQRHNVNIDDIMNNETMQHECTAKKPESTTTDSRTKMPVVKMKITASLSTTLDPATSVNASRNNYLDAIVKIISTAQSTNSNLTEARNIDEAQRSTKINNLQTNVLKPKHVTPNIDRDVETDSKRKVIIESKEDELKLQQNVLMFWEKMSKTEMPKNVDEELSKLPIISSKDMFRQQLISSRIPKLVTPRPYFTTSTPLHSNDIERLIAQFISKNLYRVSSTTTTTTQANIPDELEKTFLPFYRDLIRRYSGRQPVQDDVGSHVKENMVNEIPKRNVNLKETTEEPQIFGRNNVPDTAFRSYDNIFHNIGVINSPLKRTMFSKVPYLEEVPKQQELVDNMETLYDYSSNQRSLRINSAVNKDHSQNIPNNTLQQIAESVKSIILKDIGHLITGTTPSSTQLELTSPPLLSTMITTTSLKDPITTPEPQDKTDANHVMEKILDIYQRINAISVNTALSLDAKYTQLNIHQDHNGAPNINLAPHSITKTNVIHRTSNVHNVLFNPTSFRDLTKEELRKMPSIIQTNSGEIAPLVLPMSNPLNIINQIVVVTTDTAVKKSDVNEKVRSRFEAFMEDLNKSKIHAVAHQKNDRKHYAPNHERYSQFGYSDINHSYKDRFDIPSKHDTFSGELYDQSHRYRDLHRGAYDKNINHYGDEREHINYSEHVLGHPDVEKFPRHRHGEKFHEKLEKGDERWGDNRQDYMAYERDRGHGRHVVPRHQQPLTERKPLYDDTHFRNFLKTQEKVNDMLEKILGKKAKLDDYSVETP